MMKVIHINYSSSGGAGIAAKRISDAINIHSRDFESEFWCFKNAKNIDVNCLLPLIFQKMDGLKNTLIKKVVGVNEYSLNIIPTSLLRKLNASDADIIHLHWVNGEMISIKQLSKIKKPIIWTFHDMWAISGGEHYVNLAEKKGDNLSIILWLDNWLRKLKKRAWLNWDVQVVCPSNWLKICTDESPLFKKYAVQVIPNCIDLEKYKPCNKKIDLRNKYGISSNKKVILFGAVNPDNYRKGGDLLSAALSTLDNTDNYILLVFGQKQDWSHIDIEILWFNSVSDEDSLVEIYNLADVMCIPSRQDNLPNTCVEAHACGLPVVAFNIGGLSEIIVHKKTGFLAKPFDVLEFQNGIRWILESQHKEELRVNAREQAEQLFSQKKISSAYSESYNKLINI